MTGKASIGIVGPYPPPFGGISVHIKRIHKRLSDANYECKVYDECSLGSYALFLPRVPFLREKLLHFHCVNGKVRAVIGLLRLFGKKIVLTIHGESIMQQLKCRGLKKALLIQGLKMINHVICVNGRIAEVLKKSGIADRKISVIPAYIPPKYNNTDYCELPKPVREFLSFQPNEELDSFQANEEVEAQSRKDLIIVANGWIKPMNSASDIYGIRSLIDLAGRLCASDTNTNHFNVRFIIVLLGTGSMSREEKAYHELLVLQASPIIARGNLLIYEPEFTELYPIIERCSIFIRPTLTDGDSVSVREALHFGKPVIASDSVARPEGVVLYKTGDNEDLYNKTIHVIENYELYKFDAYKNSQKDYSEEVIEVYEKLINHN